MNHNLSEIPCAEKFTVQVVKHRMREIEKLYSEVQAQRQYNLDRTGKIKPQCFFVNSKLVSDMRKQSAVENMPTILHRLRHPIYFVQNL